MTVKKLLDLARGELGVSESPAGSNKVKYNDAYGGGPKAWCCVFIWWLFRQAEASKLFYGGGKTAYAPTLLTFHRKAGQAVVGDYRPGDVIFFDFNGNGLPDHVGLCESWDGQNITTIDGNTGEGNEANGGAVMRRTRSGKTICGAYRPAYEEECSMDQQMFDTMMEDWLARQAKEPPSSWSRMGEAKAVGVSDGTRPQSFATREEVATMILNAKER